MEFFLAGIKFLTADLWRSVALLTATIALGLYATIHIMSLRLQQAVVARDEVKAQLAKIVVDGIVQERNIVIATKALAKEKDKQVAEVKRLAKLLKDFPKDCEGAAQKAGEILRSRR